MRLDTKRDAEKKKKEGQVSIPFASDKGLWMS